MSEPNNKYYKEWLEYESKNKKREATSNSYINQSKLSRAIDKIKTEEEAKKIFYLGNKINSNHQHHYYSNNNNHTTINGIIINYPVIIRVGNLNF